METTRTGAHIVVGKSISHHHRYSAWQRTGRQQVYIDTGMTEMDWMTGVTEIDRVMGSIYSGVPGVDHQQQP
jgi:hypothetical protein